MKLEAKYTCNNCGYFLKITKRCRRYPKMIDVTCKHWCGEHKTIGEIRLLKSESIKAVKEKYNGE